MTNLTIDIGNSFIKYGIFKNGNLIFDGRCEKLLVRDVKKLYEKYKFGNCLLSTTRKSLPRFTNYMVKHHKLKILDHKTALPFKNHYSTPKTLGKDRIAAIAGAQALYPKKACVVFDIGTCMTTDFIDGKSNYLGGNISPGVRLRLKSMNDYTSALPLVKDKINQALLGKTTKTALQNGGIYGIILEIEGFVARAKRKFGTINVILTGGDAFRFGELIECKKFVKPKLVLIGLNAIIEYNESNNK